MKRPSDYFKSLNLAVIDPMTALYIKEQVLTLPNVDLLEGSKEFEELQSIIAEHFPEALGIKPKEVEKVVEVKKEEPVISGEDLKKLKQNEIDDIKSQITKIEELIELLNETLSETPNDEQSKETLELLNETLPDLKSHLTELEGKFEKGGNVPDNLTNEMVLENAQQAKSEINDALSRL